MATNNAINLSAAGVAYYNGAGAFSGVTGTAGLVLTSTGTSSAPTYQSGVDLHVSNFIVGSGSSANYATIQAAINAASSGDTIAIQPGAYTENLTLAQGLTFTSLAPAANGKQGNVRIIGKMIDNGVGRANSFFGIQFETNSDFILELTAASNMLFFGCFFSGLNNTIFSLANASCNVFLYQCTTNLNTTGITFFDISDGDIWIYNSLLQNSGGSSTPTTNVAGAVTIYDSVISAPLACTSTGLFNLYRSRFDTALTNTTCFTTAGNQNFVLEYCDFRSGTASAISIGSGTTVNAYNCIVNSTNTNAITGSGTAVLVGTSYSNSSHQTNVTAQTGGAAFGLTQGTAPSSGCIGEQIRSYIPSASPVSISTATPVNITSVSLTPGIWDVSAILGLSGTITGTLFIGAISSTTASIPAASNADSVVYNPVPPTAVSDTSLTIPSYRVTLSATTTYYLVTSCLFTIGTLTGYGRISATRVG